MNKSKIIIHIDMNAFFASCAAIDKPYLKNKVFAIGGPAGHSTRGVLSTASYKARALGIHAGMPVAEALRIYPRLLIVPTDFNLYAEKSALFMSVLKEYTPLVLEGSIDEAYMDITAISRYKHPILIAKEIQNRLLNDYGLPSSIGIAPTLFLAKMGSDYKKPLGITVVRKKDVAKMFYESDVADIYGVGKKSYERLYKVGIKTIGEFVNPENKDIVLQAISERYYNEVLGALTGNSSNIVDPSKNAIPKSISNESTLAFNTMSYQLIFDDLMDLFEKVFKRLKRHEMLTRTVGIRIKYADFTLLNRSVTLLDYTVDKDLLRREIEILFTDNFNDEEVRLVGVFFSNLIKIDDYAKHYNLFNYQQILAMSDIIKHKEEIKNEQ